MINQEAESNESEEPLCSKDAALDTRPVTAGSCGCLVVPEGCLPS